MWVMFLSSALVSIDALFIGVSFGSQKKVRFWQVVLINVFLFLCCAAGYFIARAFFDLIDFEIDIIIGILFILLGAWVITSYYISRHRQKIKKAKTLTDEAGSLEEKEEGGSIKNIIMTGLFMSVEAMFITIGVILVLGIVSFWVAVFVGLMHFVYSSVTFFLSKYLRKLPPSAGAIISGVALIVYGIMALVL